MNKEVVTHHDAPVPAAVARREPYRFESGAGTLRKAESAREQLPALKNNLAITYDTADAALIDFIVEHHLNIEWYERRIASELLKRRWLIGGTVALLGATPIALVALSLLSPGGTTVQVTAVLSSIIGVQNGLRAMFEKRNLAGIFHKASSKLKTNLYAFESEWADQSKETDAERGVFDAAIRDAVRKARDISSDEQDRFFDAVATGNIPDLKSTLTDAASAAGSLVGRFGPKASSAAAARDARMLKEKVGTLRTKLLALESQKANTPEQALRLANDIAATRASLDAAQQELLRVAVRQFDGL